MRPFQYFLHTVQKSEIGICHLLLMHFLTFCIWKKEFNQQSVKGQSGEQFARELKNPTGKRTNTPRSKTRRGYSMWGESITPFAQRALMCSCRAASLALLHLQNNKTSQKSFENRQRCYSMRRVTLSGSFSSDVCGGASTT